MSILCLLLPLALHAANLEELALARIGAARTSLEVRIRHAEFEDLSVAVRACQIQLGEKSVPLACYQALALARDWPVKPDGLPDPEHLDRLCARAARRLAFSEMHDTRSLSAICQRELAAAQKIKAYRDADPDYGPPPDSWPGN